MNGLRFFRSATWSGPSDTTTTCRSCRSTSISGTPTPSISSGLSRPDELDGVAGEGLEVVDQTGLRLDHPVGDLRLGLLVALHEASLAGVDAALVEPDLGAVLDLLEDLGAGVVDQEDAVGDDHLGSQIRVAARRSTATR